MVNLKIMSLAELDNLTNQIKEEKANREKEEKNRYYKAVIQAISNYSAIVGDVINVSIWNNTQCNYMKDVAYLTINPETNKIDVVI